MCQCATPVLHLHLVCEKTESFSEVKFFSGLPVFVSFEMAISFDTVEFSGFSLGFTI